MTGGRRVTSLAKIDVDRLSGVGPKKKEALEALGIVTVWDLLTHYPRRYIDRTNQLRLSEAVPGSEVMVLGTVRRVEARRSRNRRSFVEADVSDGTGLLRCTFFNQPWRAKQLTPGTQAVFFAKVEVFAGRRRMTNPLVDLVGDKTGRIVPVYPQSEKAGITSAEIGSFVAEALERAGEMADPVPAGARDTLGLGSRDWALRQVHAPGSVDDAERARRRLAFDELLRLQLLVAYRRIRAGEHPGIAHATGPLAGPERPEAAICAPGGSAGCAPGGSGGSAGMASVGPGELVEELLAKAPFSLTRAQLRVIDEVLCDMAGPKAMHRLLQGDVGSGKTVVAAAAMMASVQGGYQAALMAPTEVLAEQHHASISEMLAGMTVADEARLSGRRPLSVALVTGRSAKPVPGGPADVVIGTHALLSEGRDLGRLGVAVIDEQHRFGVGQRAALQARGGTDGTNPDVLVMTATPIPRTAAMTVFGDLDQSILDELPAGRVPPRTVWAAEEEAWERARAEAASGHQSYVICPLVEESGKIEARSATAEHERLSAGPLSGLSVGLLHGQMPAAAKQEAMAAFRAKELDVLVATTVIEVGVDVANATVVVIEDAGRFGIAQLHQLRGRVGRGGGESWCYLVGQATSAEAERRLRAMEESGDGFALAEVDLELRGEGTVLGLRQSGASDLKAASLSADRDLVQPARDAALELVGGDQAAAGLEMLREEALLVAGPEERELLFTG
ncbi:MAG: ATP-dependent DNA helicase RecG [Acidimicrobiales bacterium]